MRSGRRVATIWEIAPPRVVADERDVVELERRRSRRRSGRPTRGRGEVGVRRHRDDVRAERQVERHAAEVGAELGDDVAPQVRVDEHAVDEDDRSARCRRCGSGGCPAAARAHGRSEALGAPLSIAFAMVVSLHTDSMYLLERNIQPVCPTARPDRGEATRDALVAAARALFAEHGYAGVGTEEVVRPRRRSRPRRALPPLPRQAATSSAPSSSRTDGARSDAERCIARRVAGSSADPMERSSPPACARSSTPAATPSADADRPARRARGDRSRWRGGGARSADRHGLGLITGALGCARCDAKASASSAADVPHARATLLAAPRSPRRRSLRSPAPDDPRAARRRGRAHAASR